MEDIKNEEVAQSPTPVIEGEVIKDKAGWMDFGKAMEFISEGKKVTKAEWGNEYYGHLRDSFLMLRKPDGKDYKWILTDGDLAGEDYMLLPE
mgnify:CR=1 FL=1